MPVLMLLHQSLRMCAHVCNKEGGAVQIFTVPKVPSTRQFQNHSNVLWVLVNEKIGKLLKCSLENMDSFGVRLHSKMALDGPSSCAEIQPVSIKFLFPLYKIARSSPPPNPWPVSL